MDDLLAQACDPILEKAMEALEQVDQALPVSGVQLRQELVHLFETGDAVCGGSQSWQLCKYALASWIDEMLVNHLWPESSWWGNHLLEVQLFGTRLCAQRFFSQAKEAAELRPSDALKIFRLCVLLGFRGIYAQGSQRAADAELPNSIEQWLLETERQLAPEDRTRAAAPPTREILGASPQMLWQQAMWWSIAAGLLLSLNIAIYALNAI